MSDDVVTVDGLPLLPDAGNPTDLEIIGRGGKLYKRTLQDDPTKTDVATLATSVQEINTNLSKVITQTNAVKAAVDTKIDGITVGGGGDSAKAKNIVFTGLGTVTSKGDGSDTVFVDIQSPSTGVFTFSVQFAGIYTDLQALEDAVPSPHATMQAIVLNPSEKYYHVVANQWVELAPVGNIHTGYVGNYDSLGDLRTAVTSPPDKALAIVGSSINTKEFYVFTEGKWEVLNTTSLPSIDGRVSAAESAITHAQGDISGIKSDLATVKADTQILEHNLDGKLDGITLKDTEGTTLYGVKGITLDGGTVTLSEDNSAASIVIKPKITVANGQSLGSTSATGSSLIFANSLIHTDPKDPEVIHVNLPTSSTPSSGSNEFKVGSGIGSPIAVESLILPGFNVKVSPTKDSVSVFSEFRLFDTLADRDTWTKQSKGSLTSPLLCVVSNDGNNFVQTYRWDVSTLKWVEFNLQGVVLADSAGAIPKNIKTLVFGPGFSLQQAGDQEDAALLQYSGSTQSQGITWEMLGGQTNQASNVKVYPPLECGVEPSQGDTVRLLVKPGTYEPIKSPSFLGYIGHPVDVVGKMDRSNLSKSHHDGALWMDDIVSTTGAYILTDIVHKAYGIQEADTQDPNVTGGTDYLIAFRVHLRGVAPKDGIVRCYLYDKKVTPYSDMGILKDKAGHLMGSQRTYKQGQELGAITVVGVVNAKGMKEFTCHVMDTFQDAMVTLTDRGEGCTGLLIQALSTRSQTGDSLQQYILDTKESIEFNRRYLGEELMTLRWVNQLVTPKAVVPADTLVGNSEGMRAYLLTPMSVEVNNGITHIASTGDAVSDFNYGKCFTHEVTSILRGHTITVSATLEDKDSGWEVGLYKWSGAPDAYTPKVFTSRDVAGVAIPDTDWRLVSTLSIPEDVAAGEHTLTKVMSVPEDANNIAVIIYPTDTRNPMDLRLKDLRVDVSPSIDSYYNSRVTQLGEQTLYYSNKHVEYQQDITHGYGLRYTLSDKPTPLPIGHIRGGKADISLDPTVNKVVGSQAGGGEGALLFNKAGTVTVDTKYTLFTGEKVPKEDRQKVKFWWSSYDPVSKIFTEIPESVVEATVVGGDPLAHTVVAPTFTIAVELGEHLAAFAQAEIADGGYLASTSASVPIINTKLNFEELEAGGGAYDPQDLVISTLPRKLEVDRRVYEFSNNSSQNITIPVQIPDQVDLVSVSVVYTSKGVTTSLKDAEFSYNATDKTLKVHVGATTTAGKVFLNFWR